MKQFDIVIPLGSNDIPVINIQLEYTIKNVIGYRHIYIVTNTDLMKNQMLIDCVKKHIFNKIKIIPVKEDLYPFNIDTVAQYHGKSNRNGWYLQQLLKLYSGYVIPGILKKYLVIDSDTFFLKPISFIDNKLCKYNYGSQYHKPYFLHMKKLHPSLNRIISNMSGISHHMMFETKYIIRT